MAVRENEIYCQDENGAVNYRFDRSVQTIAQYKYFMRETGLFDMLQNHIISNMYDYVTGVEVGLGYNGREPTRICPHCGQEKPLSEFGFRKMKPTDDGEVRNQSWCKECRSNS